MRSTSDDATTVKPGALRGSGRRSARPATGLERLERPHVTHLSFRYATCRATRAASYASPAGATCDNPPGMARWNATRVQSHAAAGGGRGGQRCHSASRSFIRLKDLRFSKLLPSSLTALYTVAYPRDAWQPVAVLRFVPSSGRAPAPVTWRTVFSSAHSLSESREPRADGAPVQRAFLDPQHVS